MEPIVVSFRLTNTANKPVTAVLFGAAVKAQSDLLGRVLTDNSFLADDGETRIDVNQVTPGITLCSIQEYVGGFGSHVSEIKARSDYNVLQALTPFQERTYLPVGPYKVEEIAETVQIGKGEDAFKHIHNFETAYVTAPNKALTVALQPLCSVVYDLTINFHQR